MNRLAELMIDAFRGREDHVAIGSAQGTFAPQKIDKPLSAKRLADEHLAGKRCLGFYVLDSDSRCFASCADFDDKPDKPNPEVKRQAESLYYAMTAAGLHPIVEISQSGRGRHVWIFFDEPCPAFAVRGLWKALEGRLEFRLGEIYPRQDRLAGKGLGNLVRYPLWKQSHFVDVEDGDAMLDPLQVLANLKKLSIADVKMLAWELGGVELSAPRAEVGSIGDEPSDRVRRLTGNDKTLIGRRWRGDTSGLSDASKSGCAMSLVTELVRLYVPTPEIEHALRIWCKRHGAEEKGDRTDWIERTVRNAYEFVVGRKECKSTQSTTFYDAAMAFLETLEQGKLTHIKSGLDVLDESIDGAAPGEVVVIAARPGHGKSAFAAQWAEHAASTGLPVLFISEEMSAIELGKRRVHALAGSPSGHWTADDVGGLREVVKTHYEGRPPIHLVESVQTVDRCEEIIEQFAAVHGVKLVVVDYLQLLGGRGDGLYEQTSNASKRIKQVARRNDVAILLLVQMNREVEKRGGFDPQLSDLRDSGQIEQDADTILFLCWDRKIDSRAEKENYRIVCKKRRNGAIGMEAMAFRFIADRQTFKDVE